MVRNTRTATHDGRRAVRSGGSWFSFYLFPGTRCIYCVQRFMMCFFQHVVFSRCLVACCIEIDHTRYYNTVEYITTIIWGWLCFAKGGVGAAGVGWPKMPTSKWRTRAFLFIEGKRCKGAQLPTSYDN